MKRYTAILLCILLALPLLAQSIDMQAHLMSDEGKEAYTAYVAKQNAYYTSSYSYDNISATTGDSLFGILNTLMGNTCRLEQGGFSYNSLRNAYKNVDRDLNTQGNIIGYYDGRSMNGTWDGGSTWNREHTWPQSKGADKSISMGHDMQSVRPTSTAVNSDRGNTAYGESSGYYDPNDVAINNPAYKSVNMGSYRGDAARVILYDYLVYGQVGNYQNDLYNGNAQLLNKLGTNGVFESVGVILKWHMQDPPSLTEMVRNDGAQDYQGNRNPFIDFPEIAIEILGSRLTTYAVTVSNSLNMWPAYRHTTRNGFVVYLNDANNNHPTSADLVITGTSNYTYDPALGRLIVTQTTANVSISLASDVPVDPTAVDATAADHQDAAIYDILGRRVSRMQHGQIYIRNGQKFMY